MLKRRVRHFFYVIVLTSGCEAVDYTTCKNGVEGVDEAVAYAASHWPDVKDQTSYLLVSCKDQTTIESSLSSCALARVRRPESCAIHRAETGRRARIDVSHDEDAALSVCHELQHLRDGVWFTDNGCQSHELSCNYDKAEVTSCEQAVTAYRESLSK